MIGLDLLALFGTTFAIGMILEEPHLPKMTALDIGEARLDFELIFKGTSCVLLGLICMQCNENPKKKFGIKKALKLHNLMYVVPGHMSTKGN